MATIGTLKAARQIISEPAAWTKQAFARDADGKVCDVTAERATCFCMMGAVRKVIDLSTIASTNNEIVKWANYDYALKTIKSALYRRNPYGTGSISTFNDWPARGHEEVLAVFDEAIKIAQGE